MPNRPPPLRPLPLRLLRLVALAFHLGAGIATLVAVYPISAAAARHRYLQRWARRLLGILGIRLTVDLDGIRPGSLIVANHISWIDIYAINAACPSTFVSKAEVRDWPVIGWMAAKTGTIFLRRGSRGHARIVNGEIIAALDAGKFVALFPEGTTTDGSQLLHFHAALLQPAVDAGRPIVPLSLSYHGADGRRSLAPAYVGDLSLLGCLWNIVSARGLEARITAGPPIETRGGRRREIAAAAREAIAARLLAAGIPVEVDTVAPASIAAESAEAA